MPVDLGPLLRPRRVAVVGASDHEGRPHTAIWRRMAVWGDEVGAEVVPVNPRTEAIDGRPCLPSVTAVAEDGPVDLVVVLTADARPAVAEAAAVGASFAVVFGAGYAELGPEGEARQAELLAAVEGSRLRLLGPNTNLNAFESFRADLQGPGVALVTQSGHQGRPLFMAQELGIRVTGWLPTGNEADLELADGVEWFSTQPEVGAVAVYAEGFRDGPRLREALETATVERVPVVALKVGRSEVAAEAARSHTGKLAGSDRVVDAVLRQHGVTRVDDLDELMDCAQLLARAPDPPRVPGGGVVVYSISGGTGAHAVDLLAAAGVGVARLSDELQESLHELIPADLNVANPVDSGGHPVGDERGRRILELLVHAPEVGALLVPVTGPFPPLSDVLAADLVAVAEEAEIPICVVWGSPLGDEPAFREVLTSSSRLVVHRRVSNAARALRSWLDWHDHLGRADGPAHTEAPAASVEHPPSPPDPSRLLATGPLDEHGAKQLLATAGVAVTAEGVANDAAEAVAAWQTLGAASGRPVVMKALSADLAHKSDVGGVRLGVADEAGVRAAHAELARLSGGPVLVSEQIDDGVEVVVGMRRDPTFGPVVMVGAGGVLAELLDDVALRVPPFSRDEAARMIDELAVARVLAGARGGPAGDVEALVEVVMAVQDLATTHDRIAELDLNPVFVRPSGAVVADALVVVDPEAGGAER